MSIVWLGIFMVKYYQLKIIIKGFLTQSSDFDYFLKMYLMGTRHILAPEIPRTKHRGSGGAHVNNYEQDVFFNYRLFNSKHENCTMDINRYIVDRQVICLNDIIETTAHQKMWWLIYNRMYRHSKKRTDPYARSAIEWKSLC